MEIPHRVADDERERAAHRSRGDHRVEDAEHSEQDRRGIMGERPTDGRAAIGESDGTIRLSVGLEDVEDLKEDLARALTAR
jgi:hypothetical protein